MSETRLTISVVLPVRNQVKSVAAVVTACMALVGQYCADYEIILVDDGSDDGTADQVDHLAAAYDPVMVLHQPLPRGYAAGLRSAWSVARGDYIFAMNLTGPVGISELPRLLTMCPSHAVVTGYRSHLPRTFLTPMYAAIIRLLLGSDLRDPTLRFGLFRADLAELLPAQVPDGLIHAEIYTRAYRAGLSVAQVAITGRRTPEFTLRTALIDLLTYYQFDKNYQRFLLRTCIVAGGLWLLRKRWRTSCT